MSKKIKKPSITCTQKCLDLIDTVTTFIHENKNLVYIAIIGFCLSITVLYKLGQLYGLWS